MTRRELLSALGMPAAGLAVDPERLLWTPRPFVTVPAMPNQFACADWVAREALRVFMEQQRLVNLMNSAYCERFEKGDRLPIRTPWGLP